MYKRYTGLLAVVAVCTAFLFLAAPQHAEAQATVTADNGWSFTFTGNVNAFLVYESQSEDGEVGGPALVGADEAEGSTIRTGLLPAFAQFEANGTEGGVDVGVHFGFAPQIQTPGGHDNFQADGTAGAQIDMREVYLTVAGDFGEILAGRAIGVYQRQNILTDQTLMGVGATGGNFGDPAGTTLGRIGFGYVYPNYNAQIAYTTPADNPASLTVALFDPDTHNGFDETALPRLETEFSYSSGDFLGWVGGMVQYQKDTSLEDLEGDIDDSSTSAGVSGGLEYGGENFSLTGSGYWGEGIGTTLTFANARSSAAQAPGVPSTELRTSYGFIGQATVSPEGSDVTFGGSYGLSTLEAADDEVVFPETGGLEKVSNQSITGGIYANLTESLMLNGEGTYQWSSGSIEEGDDPESNNSIVFAGGLMLFF
ncbi:MAG: hypothetical protein ACOC83_06080 [Gemmatimonadota bacterium]